MDGPVVVLILKLKEGAVLHERGAKALRHHSVRRSGLDVSWHWVTRSRDRAAASTCYSRRARCSMLLRSTTEIARPLASPLGPPRTARRPGPRRLPGATWGRDTGQQAFRPRWAGCSDTHSDFRTGSSAPGRGCRLAPPGPLRAGWWPTWAYAGRWPRRRVR